MRKGPSSLWRIRYLPFSETWRSKFKHVESRRLAGPLAFYIPEQFTPIRRPLLRGQPDKGDAERVHHIGYSYQRPRLHACHSHQPYTKLVRKRRSDDERPYEREHPTEHAPVEYCKESTIPRQAREMFHILPH